MRASKRAFKVRERASAGVARGEQGSRSFAFGGSSCVRMPVGQGAEARARELRHCGQDVDVAYSKWTIQSFTSARMHTRDYHASRSNPSVRPVRQTLHTMLPIKLLEGTQYPTILTAGALRSTLKAELKPSLYLEAMQREMLGISPPISLPFRV